MKFATRSERGTLARPVWLRERESSPRRWLAGFAIFVCLSLVCVLAANTLRARSVAVAVARRAAENLAASLSQQASDTFEATSAALLTMSDSVADDGTGPVARVRLRDTMADLVRTMPRLDGLTIFDKHGRFVVSNISAEFGPSAGDRPYFQFHRTHPGPTVHISGPARSKLGPSFVIFVTRRLDDSAGAFAGVALAAIPIEYFEQIYASVDIGRLGSVKLVADDGTVLARHPRALGAAIRNAPLYADPFKYQQTGSYLASSTIDGIFRLHAFRRLGQYPVVVLVGLAESEYLAAWQSDVRANALALVLLLATIGVLAGGLGAQIGRRKSAEDALARLALLDGLTGLANRRQFDAAVASEWRTAARDQTPLALLMIDVDHFKTFNDEHGHQRGDDLLVAIARTIAAGSVRPGDIVARYGGEEFAVILPATDAPSAVAVAERIRRAVVALSAPDNGVARAIISVSVGVASIVPTRLVLAATLVEAADAALYDAKRAGRNRSSVMLCVPGPIVAASTLVPASASGGD